MFHSKSKTIKFIREAYFSFKFIFAELRGAVPYFVSFLG